MKLTYIYHSCYCIETDNYSIVIDYYKDTMEYDGYIHKNILSQQKKLYVLATHSHLDHFDGEILNWRYKVDDIQYIFSKEVESLGIHKEKDIVFLDKLEEYIDQNLLIRAYGSTDIGGSFYIEADSKRIFHAGDLNNWHWNEESTSEEIKEAEDFYASELSILANDIKVLDIAMFPIDPRLGKDFMKGAEQFVESIHVKMLAPLHFNENYKLAKQFEPIAIKNNCKYFIVDKKGQSITI